MDRTDADPEVVKTVGLFSPVATYVVSLASLVFLIFSLIDILGDFNFVFEIETGRGLFTVAVVWVWVFIGASSFWLQPYRAVITTKGKIRFDWITFSKVYDLEKASSIALVRDGEDSIVELEFSDGKVQRIRNASCLPKLASAIREVQWSHEKEH
jgi:hypothetical protein